MVKELFSLQAINTIFRALQYRNFRLFFIGQNISLIGTWMQNVAIGWMVYRMTNSAAALGLVSFASQIPSFLITPFSGVFADRWNKYKVILICQVLAMLQALVLAVLTILGHIRVWEVAVLGMTLGLISSLEIPTRHAFLVEMVDRKEDLSNAIALNSLMFNAARLIGPTIAGLLIGIWSEGVCFFVNALSYVAVIWAMWLMRIKPKRQNGATGRPFQELKAGIAYTFGSSPRRSVLFLVGLMSLIAMSQSVLMPVFARDVLKGGPSTLGFLVGSVGMGALVGAAYIASHRNTDRMLNMIPIAAGLFGISLILLSFSKILWLSMIILFFAGLGFMFHMVVSNTVLQTITEDDKRGRVMSFYTMAFMGMATFGSLLGGAIASKIGAPNTVLCGGFLCIGAGLAFSRRIPALKKKVSFA
ncbi:MAG: MFS transporter [Candidatus Omnitrophica bacterium]|jgi:MFS family permease|nr:MFS transporter [Candidatus Omnitrophota bacterium]